MTWTESEVELADLVPYGFVGELARVPPSGFPRRPDLRTRIRFEPSEALRFSNNDASPSAS
jgi:hypothetical protein